MSPSTCPLSPSTCCCGHSSPDFCIAAAAHQIRAPTTGSWHPLNGSGPLLVGVGGEGWIRLQGAAIGTMKGRDGRLEGG